MSTLLIWIAWTVSFSFGAPGPKYGPKVQPLSAMTNVEYFQKNRAPDYWSLAPYYIPQETPRGCSAANLAMLLNAVRARTPLTSDQELVTFKSLIEKYANENYRKTILGKTVTIGETLSNRNLSLVLNEALAKLKLPGARAALNIVDASEPKKSKPAFLKALQENERSSDDFIFFSFVQGTLTGDPEGGAHVATVAAYDEKKQLVLVMDPDRQWYEPYWTSVDDLFEAMSDPKSDSRKEAGWITLTSRNAR